MRSNCSYLPAADVRLVGRRSDLFEPFFTTKPSVGTGLGLWVVKQFIDSWGGQIDVESSIDKGNRGTTFRLFVPLVALSKDRPTKVETAQTLS
jgi:nitrogen-specific signal transduction histidine kinase